MEAQERNRLRAELTEWIERNREALSPYTEELEIPVIEDFILTAAFTSAADGPGEGQTVIGWLSSGNSSYRTDGLLEATRAGFQQPTGDR